MSLYLIFWLVAVLAFSVGVTLRKKLPRFAIVAFIIAAATLVFGSATIITFVSAAISCAATLDAGILGISAAASLLFAGALAGTAASIADGNSWHSHPKAILVAFYITMALSVASMYYSLIF